jgi:hypothetical protein
MEILSVSGGKFGQKRKHLARVTFFFFWKLVHGALFLKGDSFQNLPKWDRKQVNILE